MSVARWIGIALLFAGVLPARAAAREPTDDSHKLGCAIAYEQGQRLRNARRLLAARAQLVVCSAAECPAVLRVDCARWLGEVEDAMPSVVLAAFGPSGSELTDVRVELDGRLLVTRLDGRAVAVDPGARRFRFVLPSGEQIERALTLAIGEKQRPIEARFESTEPVSAPAELPSASVPTASWVLGGIGLAALAGFGYFALDGRAKKSDLDACRPGCHPDDVDAARRSFLIGDVLLAVGVSALAGATLVYATRPSGAELAISGTF